MMTTTTEGVAVDVRLRDLFHNGDLITVRLSPYAKQRYEQSLWYCWGRQDAGDDRTRGTLSGHYLGDDFAFAAWSAVEAAAYEQQYRTMLNSIGDLYERWVSALS